jgi:hypothetical protein
MPAMRALPARSTRSTNAGFAAEHWVTVLLRVRKYLERSARCVRWVHVMPASGIHRNRARDDDIVASRRCSLDKARDRSPVTSHTWQGGPRPLAVTMHKGYQPT